MVPPITKTAKGYSADFDAPLFPWVVNTPSDTAARCDALQNALVATEAAKMKQLPRYSWDWALAQKLTTSHASPATTRASRKINYEIRPRCRACLSRVVPDGAAGQMKCSISTWAIWNSYDSATQCRIVLGRQRKSASHELADMAVIAKEKPTNKFQADLEAENMEPKSKAMEEAELNAACISSDDPRLAK